MVNQPIFIVGAGRSGTTLLSRILAHDERLLNSLENRYVWNYRQPTLKHDVREACDASPKIANYIRSYYRKLAEETGRQVIDKTPSNVFRLGFVRAVFPEAKILHIIRDGRDNVLSRRREWYGGRRVLDERSASLSSHRGRLLIQRAVHLWQLTRRGSIPLSRIPIVALDNALPLISHLISGKPARYGERPPGLKEQLSAYGLLAAGAIQWREAVMHGLTTGRKMSEVHYLEIRYEELLKEPEECWRRVVDFLGVGDCVECCDFVGQRIRPENSGKWREGLTPSELDSIEPHIRPTLEFLGYDWHPA